MEDTLQKIHNHSLEEIMGERFGRYSKYIIQDRAIPDVRDGLKPVQRRIIYAMFNDKNTYNKKFRKSANAVGNTLGKYHPHGDTSVYDAMVRLSQNWKLNHQLLEIDGNNGSVDGDPAAAMRYTEARLSKISEELLKDIDKDTVIMSPNYDDTIFEPTVLPAKFPNLLVNGSSGISAGYATNIPPHNLSEVIDAVIKRIDSPNSRLETITDIVKGPDFPTGGIIQGVDGIESAFKNGKGRVSVRCKYEIVKNQIIITEIPYEVNKALLVKKINDIRLDKKIDGMTEIRDESDKESSIRIVIDLKQNADKELVINYLLKNTALQVNFNYNMVAIVNRRPKQMGILEILDAYISHQREVITKRSEFDLAFAKNKKHITEGLVKAISILDEVIALIRKSKNRSDAIKNLEKEYDFTEKQATAIVMLQLYRLTNTDITTLNKQLEDLLLIISELEKILSDESILNNVLKTELREIKKEYGKARCTKILEEELNIEISEEDLVKEENCIVVLTKHGYLKRVSLKSYSSSTGETMLKPNDFIISKFDTNTLEKILIITSFGNYIYLPVFELENVKWNDLGVHISNIVTLHPDEEVINSFLVNDNLDDNIVLCSRNGFVKKVILKDFIISRYFNTYKSFNLKKGDILVSAFKEKDQLLFVSKDGYYLLIDNDEIKTTSPKSGGVIGISLKEDILISALSVDEDDEYITVFTNQKTAKRVKLDDLGSGSRANRGSKIIKSIKSTDYSIISALATTIKDSILLIIDNKASTIKNVDIPIKNLDSTGSKVANKKIINVYYDIS